MHSAETARKVRWIIEPQTVGGLRYSHLSEGQQTRCLLHHGRFDIGGGAHAHEIPAKSRQMPGAHRHRIRIVSCCPVILKMRRDQCVELFQPGWGAAVARRLCDVPNLGDTCQYGMCQADRGLRAKSADLGQCFVQIKHHIQQPFIRWACKWSRQNPPDVRTARTDTADDRHGKGLDPSCGRGCKDEAVNRLRWHEKQVIVCQRNFAPINHRFGASGFNQKKLRQLRVPVREDCPAMGRSPVENSFGMDNIRKSIRFAEQCKDRDGGCRVHARKVPVFVPMVHSRMARNAVCIRDP